LALQLDYPFLEAWKVMADLAEGYFSFFDRS
jgi:hypothetical protein